MVTKRFSISLWQLQSFEKWPNHDICPKEKKKTTLEPMGYFEIRTDQCSHKLDHLNTELLRTTMIFCIYLITWNQIWINSAGCLVQVYIYEMYVQKLKLRWLRSSTYEALINFWIEKCLHDVGAFCCISKPLECILLQGLSSKVTHTLWLLEHVDCAKIWQRGWWLLQCQQLGVKMLQRLLNMLPSCCLAFAVQEFWSFYHLCLLKNAQDTMWEVPHHKHPLQIRKL